MSNVAWSTCRDEILSKSAVWNEVPTGSIYLYFTEMLEFPYSITKCGIGRWSTVWNRSIGQCQKQLDPSSRFDIVSDIRQTHRIYRASIASRGWKLNATSQTFVDVAGRSLREPHDRWTLGSTCTAVETLEVGRADHFSNICLRRLKVRSPCCGQIEPNWTNCEITVPNMLSSQDFSFNWLTGMLTGRGFTIPDWLYLNCTVKLTIVCSMVSWSTRNMYFTSF